LIDKGNVVEQNVVIDNHCITSRGAGTSCEFALTLVEVLYSKEKKQQVAQGLALLIEE
jgi:4-methyl-5(b-hydroxyethyl)-thiazole monophosphate biosynthesis